MGDQKMLSLETLHELVQKFPLRPKEAVMVGDDAIERLESEFGVEKSNAATKLYGIPIFVESWVDRDCCYLMSEELAKLLDEAAEKFGGPIAKAMLDKLMDMGGTDGPWSEEREQGRGDQRQQGEDQKAHREDGGVPRGNQG